MLAVKSLPSTVAVISVNLWLGVGSTVSWRNGGCSRQYRLIGVGAVGARVFEFRSDPDQN